MDIDRLGLMPTFWALGVGVHRDPDARAPEGGGGLLPLDKSKALFVNGQQGTKTKKKKKKKFVVIKEASLMKAW
ncbi:hypothetical protein HPP92_018359 [Vanilla planifolia]|uniref:Uncharacterized protein n=1 Tax=Vanilla planifolia TaxID=51239 RepID=A0A835Q6Q0_VANPL|nr:hypothetical protein HPP92_018970 [Vanilla planifolia]KAG0469031.1 hypothetical protein HPP92_018359 [Vanilla planifolia]